MKALSLAGAAILLAPGLLVAMFAWRCPGCRFPWPHGSRGTVIDARPPFASSGLSNKPLAVKTNVVAPAAQRRLTAKPPTQSVSMVARETTRTGEI
jgi:hypothetical protein